MPWTAIAAWLAVVWAATTAAGLALLARGRWIDRNTPTGR